jgi:hypothetical protein
MVARADATTPSRSAGLVTGPVVDVDARPTDEGAPMARPTLARRLAAVSLLTTLALTTAACGNEDASSGTDTSGSSTDSAEPSTEPSTEASTEASTEMSTQEPTEESEESARSSGDLEELSAQEFYPAVMEALREAGTFAFTLDSGADGAADASLEMQGVMRYDDGGIDLQASGRGQGSEELEMIMLDKVLYINGIGMELGDKEWLKIDMSDPDSLFGMLGRSADPEMMFKAMEEPAEFELVGTEEVDGVDTNRYRIVMDTSSYAEAMEIPAQMASSLPEDIAVEMWVDGDDLPRRFRQEVEVPAMGGRPATTSTTEGTYTDYGAEVTIEAPPASEVADQMPGM